MTTMFCPHCGTEVSSEFNFCPKCGARIALGGQQSAISNFQSTDNDSNSAIRSSKSETVLCPTCGFQNPSDARSCESCGTFLKSAVGSQQSGPEADEPKAASIAGESNFKGKEAEWQRGTKARKKSSKSDLVVNKQTRRFHLQSYQVVSIAAALLLGGILVYGLMSSKPVASQQDDTGNAAQQQSTTTQPSADVIHEIDRLRQIVDKKPSDLVSTLRLSNMLQDNGMYDQAVIYYKRYLDKIPDNVDAQVDYGVTLYEGGHTQESIDELNQAIKMDPKHQKAYFNLGIVYLNAGEIDKSNEVFRKCVQIDPQSDVGKQAEQIMTQHVNIKN